MRPTGPAAVIGTAEAIRAARGAVFLLDDYPESGDDVQAAGELVAGERVANAIQHTRSAVLGRALHLVVAATTTRRRWHGDATGRTVIALVA